MMRSALERSVLHHLQRSTEPERFELPAACELALRHALQLDLEGSSPVDAIVRALKLAAALDGALGSPTAAARVRRVLQSDRRAIRLIRERILKLKGFDETRAFARREGRESSIRAPALDEPAPVNTLPLRSLLDPSRMAPPAVARARRVNRAKPSGRDEA